MSFSRRDLRVRVTEEPDVFLRVFWTLGPIEVNVNSADWAPEPFRVRSAYQLEHGRYADRNRDFVRAVILGQESRKSADVKCSPLSL